MQRNARSHLPASNADIRHPVESHGIAAARGDAIQPLTATLGENDRGDPAVLIPEAFQDGLGVRQRKRVVRVGGKQAPPGVENHHHVGTVSDLLRKIRNHRLGVDRQNAVEKLGPGIEHAPHSAEIGAARPLDHVAGECEGTAGETDQGHASVQCQLDRSDRVIDVPKAGRIGRHQPRDRRFVDERPLEPWPFALRNRESQAHCVRDREDVGKKNSRVERKTRQRLKRYLGGEGGVGAKLQEATGASAGRIVFGQIAARLTHQPHGGVLGGLALKRAQKRVVFQGTHRWIASRRTGAGSLFSVGRQQGPAAKAFENRQWRALRIVESGNRNVNRLLEHVLA